MDAPGPAWLAAIRRYLIVSAAGHSVWEVGQLPLYTLWRSATRQEIAFAVLHCTAGDVLIAAAALLAALVFAGVATWPASRYRRVAACTMLTGIGYTAWSEYWNATVKSAWQYADTMPLVPGLGVGITPLLQWLVVPALALFFSRDTRWPVGN